MITLAFDGCDKTGKDTLIKAFHKKTGFKHPCINRWCATSYVYGQFYDRELDYKFYLLKDFYEREKIIYVILYASVKDLKRRFLEHDEKDIDVESTKDVMDKYLEYGNLTPAQVIFVNTSQPIDDCVNEIIAGIEEFEEMSLKDKVDDIQYGVKVLGDKVAGTKELRNVELHWDNERENVMDTLLDVKELRLWDEDELKEYNVILHTLNNEIRLLTKYFKSQDLESRQFVFNSKSCISYYHVLLREEELYVTVHLRSSDVEKMLLLDCYGISYVAEALNEEYFEAKKIHYTLNIDSAHAYMERK